MIISLGVKTNNEVDELMHKVEALGGKVIDEPKTSQGYYGATFADSDEHKKGLQSQNFEGSLSLDNKILVFLNIAVFFS